MAGLDQLLGLVLLIWIIGFGFSVMTRTHRNYLTGSARLAAAPFRSFWRSFRTQIIWFVLGAATLYYLLIGIP